MERKVMVKGQNINVVKAGDGPHKLICCPGALGTIWTDFKPQIEGLDRNIFTVIVWDPPGYGKSRPPERIFDFTMYESDADATHDLMQALEYDKYSVLGWSDGGHSGMITAAKYPDHVEKLVVWATNAFITEQEKEVFRKMIDISAWSEQMKAPFIEVYTEEIFQDMWRKWCNNLIEVEKNGGNICTHLLPHIKCPTFILHGDKDPMILPEHASHLASKIKISKVLRFPEGKHNLHLKYSDEFNGLVTEFLLQEYK
ncbi:unnamed protein product [Acanthoscelides obtectus]|uniref:AB hydrolase-1 domain-containing protein n=1 Tax=Acanthoscelides obtectus TaxID=200917 RepID=A0A9P0LVF5_ACAOB|nr:unnamed protein product [Acanthoscelides obtectus]CAK1642364.1 Valacyclovir hydrolase [Acanthoscelides obtectus]